MNASLPGADGGLGFMTGQSPIDADVVSIYEAKTQFSKLVKRAKSGEIIYIGAYGRPEAVLAPVPAGHRIRFGVLEHLRDPNFDDSPEGWAAMDDAVTEMLEGSADEGWDY